MIKINYILVPKDIIYDTELGKNRVILFSYFASKRGLDNTVGFSCDNIVKWCGYQVNNNKNKSNEQFTTLLSNLSDGGYINITGDVIHNNYTYAKLNIEKFDVDSQFALIYLDEINTLKQFKKSIADKADNKISVSILLLLLSYIRLNLLRRQDKYIGNKSDKPEFCYRMYLDIEKDIGISSRYISKAVNVLEELNLIATSSIPRYKDESGNWHTEVTLFANRYRRIDGGESIDPKYDYKQELSWGEEYIKEKKFLSKKFEQNI